jgi:exodeoxyribonuclease VII large subunit
MTTARPHIPSSRAERSDVAGNVPEYSVSELSASLKRTVEQTYDRVRVRGEVSGFKRAASGHLYMSLKDETAVLDAVCWRGTAASLTVAPEDGLEVVATGRLTTYPGRSKYQIVIDSLDLAGEGALLKLLEDRRRKLAAEGLFDAERKRPLPYLPEVIGVVTSPTGAVIRDILHRLRDRFPRRVLLWPVLVQGEGAANQIAAAITGFNELPQGGLPRPDLLIVARGGGSIEDLWAFNEEIVVRAAAQSEIPLISAVGHETDTTLIDFAADVRAPTPTAAAEMSVPVRSELIASVLDFGVRLQRAAARHSREKRLHLQGLERGMRGPRDVLQRAGQRFDDTVERLARAWLLHGSSLRRKLAEPSRRFDRVDLRRSFGERRERLLRNGHVLRRDARRVVTECRGRVASLERVLRSLSYTAVLERGFAVIRSEGKLVTRGAGVAAGAVLDIEFHDGHVGAVAAGERPVRPPRKAGGAGRRGPRPGDDVPDGGGTQGTLL